MFSEELFWKLIRDGDPRQVDEIYFLRKLPDLLDLCSRKINILDFGAGVGKSKNQLENILPNCDWSWTGVDIVDSQEVLSRGDSCPSIDYYDGKNLPYETNSFDVVWSHQVLEHVRYPDVVVGEIARVLRKDGLFIGAVSQLEPYHSRSIFNWTPYGICTVLNDHNLEIFELKPGVDGFIMIMRTLFGYNIGLNDFFLKESPFSILLNSLINSSDLPDKEKSESLKWKNIAMAGHLHFAARRV